jgi:hypothetical protein
MQLIRFKSEEPKTAFAPVWDYTIGEDYLSRDIVYWSLIKNIILKKEKEIINSTRPSNENKENISSYDGYTGLGVNSLTSRFQSFNVFKWEEYELTVMKEGIKKKYFEYLRLLNIPRRKVWIQCWANVMRKGEVIKPHLHGVGPYSYLGGHISVTCNNTSTFYINPVNQINDPEVYESKNEIGKITLFESCVPHYTSVNNSDHERITIAFDFIVDEDKNDKSNLILLDDIDN